MPSSTPIRMARPAAAAMIAAAMLAGCSKAPKGQVVASVNGTDVTQRELLTELRADNAPANIDLKAVQPLVAQQVVDRKLLVQEAKRTKLDRTPEYLATEQRADEVLLAQQLVQKWSESLPTPDDNEVQAFVTANPQMFAGRKLLVVDQLRTSAVGLDPARLKPLNSMDAIVAYLNEAHHPFDRGTATLDTATMSQATAARIAALPQGMPFVAAQNGQATINVVQEAKPVPVPDASTLPLARAALRQQQAQKALKDQLASLRRSAKIEYQPGYAPPAKKAAPGA